MAETLTFSTPDSPRIVPARTVYVRANWFDDWEEIDYLYCESVTFAASPGMGRAQLVWRYGRVQQAGTSSYDVFERLDKLRWYVKVAIDQPNYELEFGSGGLSWYGVLEQDASELRGLLAEGQPSGKQTLTAFGLDIMLERHVLRQSTVEASDGSESTVARGIEFNHRAQLDGQEKEEAPNRSNEMGGLDAYIFANDLTSAQFWSSLDAVNYLLTYQAPTDDMGGIEITWELAEGLFVNELPNLDQPRKACHGRSLRQVLDELIDRRRLLGYTIDVSEGYEGGDVIQVVPFTFTATDIELDDFTVSANIAQKALVFDNDSGLKAAVLTNTTKDAIDQVVASGERVVACFTLRAADEELVEGWSDAQQGVYETGASEVAEYAGDDLYVKEKLNEIARKQDSVKRVYAAFTLPPDWDGTVDEGTPYFPDPSNEDEPTPFYQPQLRFLHHLPFKSDHDYSEDPAVDNTPEGARWEYRPLLAMIALPDDSGRYAKLHTLSSQVETLNNLIDGPGDDQLIPGCEWSAEVRPLDDAPGAMITVHGAPQHVLAGEDFTPLDDDPAVQSPQDWQEIVLTVAMEIDLHVESRWPTDDDLTDTQVVRRLIVDLGDEFKQHYVVPDTIWDVKEDGTLQTTDGGFIRDDSDALGRVARVAYEWYAVERQSIKLQFAYITVRLVVGDLITTIGSDESEEQINSVVTSLRFDFPEHEGVTPAGVLTTITTGFAELDPSHLLSHGKSGRVLN